jgi:hypothetical protein
VLCVCVCVCICVGVGVYACVYICERWRGWEGGGGGGRGDDRILLGISALVGEIGLLCAPLSHEYPHHHHDHHHHR